MKSSVWNQVSDIQGYTRMIKDVTIGITSLVEEMQHSIVHPSFLPSTPIQDIITGISKISFTGVKIGARLVGGGLDTLFGQLSPVLQEKKSSAERENYLSILNGIVGDYLEKTSNPLCLPMRMKNDGKEIDLDSQNISRSIPNVSSKIILMVHGLCMNDSRWMRNGHHHGESLCEEINATTIHLNYNTGRRISTNGREFSQMLEELVSNWPVAVEEINIIAHSMGGLVSRSAIYYGENDDKQWIRLLKKMVFLGTPHHGAPLARIGSQLDFLMDSTPYVKPFTRLTKIRSVGITDLRYGNLIDEDWMDAEPNSKDSRNIVALPEQVQCFAIAASTAINASKLSGQIVGDGLVSVSSALGKHKNDAKNLHFPSSKCKTIYDCNHLGLLNNSEVYHQINQWISD